MRKLILAAILAATSTMAQADSCQLQLSRHSSVACQFGYPNVIVQQHQHRHHGVPPPAWTQAPVFQQQPPVYIYVEPQPQQYIYVYPQQQYVPRLPYQPNPYMPYYQPNPYRD